MIAPPLYPYTGSKRLLADTIWPLLGSPGHYIEPFAGSAAVLLARPGGHCGTETINDADGLIANVWRAIRLRSDAVLDAIMESPASCEVDVHAHHIRLIKARDALVPRLQGDPDYCDPRLAGWWIRGACEWNG